MSDVWDRHAHIHKAVHANTYMHTAGVSESSVGKASNFEPAKPLNTESLGFEGFDFCLFVFFSVKFFCLSSTGQIWFFFGGTGRIIDQIPSHGCHYIYKQSQEKNLPCCDTVQQQPEWTEIRRHKSRDAAKGPIPPHQFHKSIASYTAGLPWGCCIIGRQKCGPLTMLH